MTNGSDDRSGPIAPCSPSETFAIRLDGLFRQEAPRLLRYFRQRTGDHATAPDMVQDVFVRFAGSGTQSDLTNPVGYLHRIARNLLFNRTRDARRAARHIHIPIDDVALSIAPEQEQGIELQDLLGRYEQALSSLKPKTREVFLLSRRDGLSYSEIQAHLGISMGSVEYHMMRAIAHVDAVLSEA